MILLLIFLGTVLAASVGTALVMLTRALRTAVTS